MGVRTKEQTEAHRKKMALAADIYTSKLISIRAAAAEVGASFESLAHYMRAHGIERRDPNEFLDGETRMHVRRKDKILEALDMVNNQSKTTKEAARMTGVCESTIRKHNKAGTKERFEKAKKYIEQDGMKLRAGCAKAGISYVTYNRLAAGKPTREEQVEIRKNTATTRMMSNKFLQMRWGQNAESI